MRPLVSFLITSTHDSLPGIATPMYYIGSTFSRFCMHLEDAFLCSLSFLHTYGEYSAKENAFIYMRVFGICVPICLIFSPWFSPRPLWLYSGAAKTWYVIPASDADKVEQCAKDVGMAAQLLLRKDAMLSPRYLLVSRRV